MLGEATCFASNQRQLILAYNNDLSLQTAACRVAKQGLGDGKLWGRCARACGTSLPYVSRDAIGQVVRHDASASLQGTAQSDVPPADLKLPYYLPSDVEVQLWLDCCIT